MRTWRLRVRRGQQSPWQWGANVGHLWRTTGDISDNYASMLSVTLGFQQAIGAREPLRTGGYGKTLTCTLSTTQP